MHRGALTLALALAACSGQEFSSAGADAGGGSAGTGGAAGAGGASGIPTNGLVLWLDAQQDVDVEGTAVVTWHDRSPASNDATQGTASARPSLQAAGLNGLPAIHFDGQDDELQLPAGFVDFSLGLTFFAVVDSATSGTCPPILQLSNGSEIDDISIQRDGASQLSYEVGADYYNGVKNLYPTGSPVLVGVTHGPAGAVRLFGGGASEAAASFPVPPQVKRTQNFVGRGLYAGCSRHEGWMAELVLYRRKLTDAERNEVQAYLANKWGF